VYIFFNFGVTCIGWKSTYKTNLTCLAIYVQQTHQISFYMFRHSMVAIIRESSLLLKSCFRNGPLYAAQSQNCTYIKVLWVVSPVLFDVHRAVHRNITSIVKPTGRTNVSNLFYFGMTLHMFRKVFPSIIRSSRLYIQLSNRYCCLLASKQTAVSV